MHLPPSSLGQPSSPLSLPLNLQSKSPILKPNCPKLPKFLPIWLEVEERGGMVATIGGEDWFRLSEREFEFGYAMLGHNIKI
jgi:hypothetical protein